MKEYVEQGYVYATILALSKYFDTLNYELLVNLLRSNVKDERDFLALHWERTETENKGKKSFENGCQDILIFTQTCSVD